MVVGEAEVQLVEDGCHEVRFARQVLALDLELLEVFVHE
jgi:hypothetical protein